MLSLDALMVTVTYNTLVRGLLNIKSLLFDKPDALETGIVMVSLLEVRDSNPRLFGPKP